jgi:hypothetical protein
MNSGNQANDRPQAWIGIDPGLSGAIAIIGLRNCFIETFPLRDLDENQIFNIIFRLRYQYAIQWAYIENVHAVPASMRGPVATAKLLESYGILKTALSGNGIGFDRLSPVRWQNLLGCRTGGKKRISRDRARQLFPETKVTHTVADALLLAHLCRATARSPQLAALLDTKGIPGHERSNQAT